MTQTTAGAYSRWLEQHRSVPTLHEGQVPPERWLQHLWRHQRLVRDQLRTEAGGALHVLHPGFWNRGAGPDFKGAILQFDDGPPVTGDVEIDIAGSGWVGHRHAGNPAYGRVILRVLWDGGETGAGFGIPLLAMRRWLDAPLEELVPWLLGEAPGLIPANVRGGCAAPLRRLTDAGLTSLLEEAARHRLVRKAMELGARARHVGWDQALWEGLLGGLGYRHNCWPLRRIAELVPMRDGPEMESVESAQARLLGLGGFLPVESGSALAPYVRRLWDHWWRDRARFGACVLPGECWRLGGLRPANHPQRRLALAGHWLCSAGLSGRVLGAILDPGERPPAERLLTVLDPGLDGFWREHWTLGRAGRGVGPLLGSARLTDLAINVILPWLWMRASVGLDAGVRGLVEQRYREWPAGEDNAVLRMARLRLLGGERRRLPARAVCQQGFLQISDDFCSATDSLCAGCGFPALAAAWAGGG